MSDPGQRSQAANRLPPAPFIFLSTSLTISTASRFLRQLDERRIWASVTVFMVSA
jgi:hypothetical protein